MDDLTEKLSQMLNDPETMKSVTAMASELFGGSDSSSGGENMPDLSALSNLIGANKAGGPPPPKKDGSDALPGMPLDPKQMAMIARVIGAVKNNGDDSRIRLIAALKPHLSPERQKRADNAIKMLRIISVLPMIKDSGIFDLL